MLKIIISLIVSWFYLIVSHHAVAQLQIDITQGSVAPLPIAIPSFYSNKRQHQELGASIGDVISANLERSKLFRSIDKNAFIQIPTSIDIRPRFNDWRLIGSQAMVQGVINDAGNGKVRVEMRLWDVLSEQQMLGKLYTASTKS